MFNGLDKLKRYVDGVSQLTVVQDTLCPPAGKDWSLFMIEMYKAYGGTPVDLYH